MDHTTTPDQPASPDDVRAALLQLLDRLDDAAVARLLAFVRWWVQGPPQASE
jgi:hypothetical protein